MLVKYAYVDYPELRYLADGRAVFKFQISVKRYDAKEKKPVGLAAYYNVELWGDEAQSLADQLEDGDQVSIEKGLLSSNSYEKDGKKNYKCLIQFPEGIEVHKKRTEEEVPF